MVGGGRQLINTVARVLRTVAENIEALITTNRENNFI